MSFCCTLENKQNPSHVSAKQNAVKTFLLDKVSFLLPPSPHRSDRSLKPLLDESPNCSALRKQRSPVKFRTSKHPNQGSLCTTQREPAPHQRAEQMQNTLLPAMEEKPES